MAAQVDALSAKIDSAMLVAGGEKLMPVGDRGGWVAPATTAAVTVAVAPPTREADIRRRRVPVSEMVIQLLCFSRT